MGVQPDTAVRQVLRDRDPYSLTLDAMWELLESSTEFTTLVKPGNRIKFTGQHRDPVKSEISPSDVPEVRIIVTGSEPHAHRTSCSHSDKVRFEVQVSSGDQRFDAMHLPLKFVIFRAMAEIEQFLREKVVWHTQKVVKLANAVSVTEGVMQSDLNRGIVGWSALWACEVELWFQADTLRR